MEDTSVIVNVDKLTKHFQLIVSKSLSGSQRTGHHMSEQVKEKDKYIESDLNRLKV